MSFFPEVCRAIHGEMVGLYWMLLPFFLPLFVVALDFFLKIPEGNPQAGDVVKRIVHIHPAAHFLLDICMETIAFLGDGLAEKNWRIQKAFRVTGTHDGGL